ncbi:MAG: tetratricopeptide repeat protein, partial [Clostridia bacterium]|nr:tetratricopeptide repeat protein [Clostridia bacterium]
MKRAVSVLLIICMAFCAGCGEANPTVDVEAQLLEADRLFFEGNYEEVILTLETVLEVEPATVRGYLRLSDAYIARGEEDKALELLQRGLEITGDEEIAAR